MTRGGKREGAGRKAAWKSGACKPVKLPDVLVDEVMRYAHQLDDGQPSTTSSTESDDQWSPVYPRPKDVEGWEARYDELMNRLRSAIARRDSLDDDLFETRREAETLKSKLVKLEREDGDLNGRIYKAFDILRAGVGRPNGVRGSDARAALAALTTQHDPGPAAAFPIGDHDRHPIGKLVDEKQELQRRVRHLEDILAKDRKKLQYSETRERQLQGQIDSATSVLRYAYDEHRKGVRRGILTNVTSALLALGLDVDAPPVGSI